MAQPQQIFQFRSQFPEFASVADADISSALDLALLWVDPKVWSAADYPMGLMFWAAHFQTLRGWQLASVEFGGTGSTDIFIRSISFGERHIAFGERRVAQNLEKMLGPGEQLLTQTIYGQLYLNIRQRNVVPVLVV